ncbi:uncharacterized protein si:ch211-136m16.8 [Betta splendens]|uniref:Uncharacterized protein si:ch211-136m16.8 n=1 Tax=Betta splendens TaxID=158456 RepID=A0A6P7L602_BETSP|nr:uncharacterized protein si:ch211-136m16.8 [Betta splendens]
MDPDGPVARAGRTFWTVWCYVTEAVNRFFRPELTNTDSSDPSSVQESAANSEPTEDSTGGGGHHEHPPLPSASLPRSSGVVSWDSGLRPQSKTQQRTDAESKGSEEQETKGEEQSGQTRSDDGGHAMVERDEEENEKCEMGKMTPNTGVEKREEPVTELEVNKEDKHDLEEVDGGMDLYKMTDHNVEEEDDVNKDKAETGAKHGDVENHVSVLEKSPENENKSDEDVSTCKQLSDPQGDEEEADEEDVSILQEREQCGQENTTGPEHKKTMDENPEQEDGSQTDTGGRGERERLPERLVCSQEASLAADAELNTEEEQEDVAERSKTNTSGADCANASTTCVVEEHWSSEEDDSGATMEISRAPTSVTVTSEAEVPQETSRELENHPLRSCEGRAAVSPGLHSTACEETREGVPEYNNEPGPDENTPQTFLEVGDGKEMQTTQLPEEVKRTENSGSTAAGDLLVKERGGEEQEERHIDAGLLRDGVKPLVEQIIQRSIDSMKTVIERSEKEFETDTVSADDTTETEELLAEVGADGRLRDARDAGGDGSDSAGPVAAGGLFGIAGRTSEPADAELLKIMNPSVFQESSDENCNIISSLLEVNKSGFPKESDEGEPKTRGDFTEGTEYEPEEGAAEDEAQNKIHVGFLDVQLVDEAAEPIKETYKNQDKTLEISNEETLKDTEATDEVIIAELQSQGLTVTSEEDREAELCYVEGTSRGHEGVIDEEILDLWIQTASSEDTDQVKQEEDEQQADAELHQEPPETLPEVEDEQLPEPNAGESRLVSDTEMSSFTAESGVLDQPLDRSGTESFQDYVILASMSETANVSDLSNQQTMATCQDAVDTEQSDMNEEKSFTEAGFITDSEAGHQEPYKSQGGSDGEHTELLENDTGSQKEDAGRTDQNPKTDLKDTEEAGVDLQTNGENAEKTEHPKSGSYVLLEDEIKSRESNSQNLTEVDASLLDFTAQRSRIALKNPRVRPPKDPRALLHMPSLQPTPTSHLQVKVPAGGPLGGLGVGIKLPGLGAGFPVLKKTRVVTDENGPEKSTESETKTDDNNDLPKHDEVPQRPKWMPPKHPGFGNPLMSELKNKLKKTTTE